MKKNPRKYTIYTILAKKKLPELEFWYNLRNNRYILRLISFNARTLKNGFENKICNGQHIRRIADTYHICMYHFNHEFKKKKIIVFSLSQKKRLQYLKSHVLLLRMYRFTEIFNRCRNYYF